MPYRVPKSRLLPPRTAREVERKRLEAQVQEAFSKTPVLVIAAGAGYGKSTLMSGLAQSWLTLAEDCQDPVVLGWHLLEAYRSRLSGGVPGIESALERGAWAAAVEALLEGVMGLPSHTLALDEAQRAASRETLGLMRTLSQAPNLRMAILTRRAAPWEVIGRVLSESDLAFDAAEALELGRILSPGLAAFEVERAHSLVRGWPLGLRLLMRAMERGSLPEEAYYAHPDPEGLLNYLLPTLPKTVQQLAAKASVFSELGPDEAEWVGERGLLEFHAADLLLEKVGNKLRFHPLVRQALMSQLEPTEVRSLLVKAADAALARGEDVRAAGYLLEAGRSGHAADLLQNRGNEWLGQGLTYTVLNFLEQIPESLRVPRPELRLLHAEALRQAGRYTDAEALYKKALEAGNEQALLGLSRLYLDTVEPTKAQAYLELARTRFPQPSARLWAENQLNLGKAGEALRLGLEGPRVWLRAGQPVRALLELRHLEAHPRDPAARVPQNHREGTLLLALLETIAGDPRQAEMAAEKGRREGETLGSPFVVALAEARMGHALLAQNQWQGAGQAYERSLLLSEGGPFRLRVEALGGLAALGDSKAYTEMVRLSRESGDAWVEAFLTLMAAQAHARQGKSFDLPRLSGTDDPFLLALAASYPHPNPELLTQYAFLQASTLLAFPLHQTRRVLWEQGLLAVPYYPGVQVEVQTLGQLDVRVSKHPIRFKREKTRLLLALLLTKDWSKETLIEALEVSDGEFRVLWSELLGALEPGRPGRAAGYFLKPYALARVDELTVDLDQDDGVLAPLEGFDHPEIEAFRTHHQTAKRRRWLLQNQPAAWLKALQLEPTDEALVERLLDTPLATDAWAAYSKALNELGLLPNPQLLKRLSPINP